MLPEIEVAEKEGKIQVSNNGGLEIYIYLKTKANKETDFQTKCS